MKEDMLKRKFLNIYEAEADSIFRYCLFRISNRETAVDMTQDTFTKFWDALYSGREIKNDRAFIYMIAKNLVIDFYRKKKSVSLDSLLEENEEGMFLSVPGTSKEELELSSEAKFVMEKIKELSGIDQQLVYLRFVDDLKPKEIAEILGITPNAVSVRIIRVIDKLKGITGYKEDE